MISEYNIDKKLNQFAPLGEASEFGVFENGGEGSGNFGHSGRPGQVGGSGDGEGAKTKEPEKKLSEKQAELNDELRMDGRLKSDDRKALVREEAYSQIAKKIYEWEFDHNRDRSMGYEKPASRGDRIIAKKLGFDTTKFSDSDMMTMSSEEFWKEVYTDLERRG